MNDDEPFEFGSLVGVQYFETKPFTEFTASTRILMT